MAEFLQIATVKHVCIRIIQCSMYTCTSGKRYAIQQMLATPPRTFEMAHLMKASLARVLRKQAIIANMNGCANKFVSRCGTFAAIEYCKDWENAFWTLDYLVYWVADLSSYSRRIWMRPTVWVASKMVSTEKDVRSKKVNTVRNTNADQWIRDDIYTK